MADLSLHQIEFAGPESWAVVGLLALTTAISQVKSLRGLVSAWNLGELALIPYSIGSELLPGNAGQG